MNQEMVGMTNNVVNFGEIFLSAATGGFLTMASGTNSREEERQAQNGANAINRPVMT